MKLILPILIVLNSAALVFAQPIRAGPSAKLPPSSRPRAGLRRTDRAGPTAQQLLEGVVAQLPREPLTVTGGLKVRKRRGVVIRELKFEMFLNWGSKPAITRYTIRDAFGTDLEQLTVIRSKGKEPRFAYAAGSPLLPANPPNLFESILGTDISWADLTFSFLWWHGGSITGTEKIRGRQCYVVEVPAPAAKSRYSKVLLWIDVKLHMLLQAEARDSGGKLIRRLWVKSFKKINDRWMIKDMEIQSFPAIHRTKLRVSEVNVK